MLEPFFSAPFLEPGEQGPSASHQQFQTAWAFGLFVRCAMVCLSGIVNLLAAACIAELRLFFGAI